MDLQDLTTVQALLCLTQYYFRAPVRRFRSPFSAFANIIRLNLKYGLAFLRINCSAYL